MAETTATSNPPDVVEISASDLPACCPPAEIDPASLHPRVYLPIKKGGGHAVCPYCGAEYRLHSDTV